jgi:hypothetical protein
MPETLSSDSEHSTEDLEGSIFLPKGPLTLQQWRGYEFSIMSLRGVALPLRDRLIADSELLRIQMALYEQLQNTPIVN